MISAPSFTSVQKQYLPRGKSKDLQFELAILDGFFPGFSMHENLHPLKGIGQVLLLLARFLKFHNWSQFLI